MTSRRAWLAGAAALGVAAGAAGLALRLARPSVSVGPAGDKLASDKPANLDIWPMRFATPSGADLPMQPFRGKPLLLNFWATWCPPCVGELPLLDRFQRDHAHAGWQVVGLAVDNVEPVTGFLARRPLGFPIGMAGAAGIELSRRLGNGSGALPFSVVFGRNGEIVGRRLGTVRPDDLQAWVDAAA